MGTMNQQDLENRITACNRELRRNWFWIALFPLIVFFSAIGCVLLKLSFWPLGAEIFIAPFLMSVLLTQLVNRASIRAGLICPHCGAPLGGFVKQARRGVCPICSGALLDRNPLPESTITSGAAAIARTRKPPIASIFFLILLCMAGSIFAYWLVYHGIEQGHIILPDRFASKIVYRGQDPNLFWVAVTGWILCGTSPIFLLVFLRYRAIKRGAQQRAPADGSAAASQRQPRG